MMLLEITAENMPSAYGVHLASTWLSPMRLRKPANSTFNWARFSLTVACSAAITGARAEPGGIVRWKFAPSVPRSSTSQVARRSRGEGLRPIRFALVFEHLRRRAPQREIGDEQPVHRRMVHRIVVGALGAVHHFRFEHAGKHEGFDRHPRIGLGHRPQQSLTFRSTLFSARHSNRPPARPLPAGPATRDRLDVESAMVMHKRAPLATGRGESDSTS